jgi:hypothetical protein
MAVIRHRRCPEYQFGARLAFMQLLKASALLPAVDNAAWRSQSDASRPRLFALLLSLGKGLLLSYCPEEFGRGGTQPAKSIIATSILVFIYATPLSPDAAHRTRPGLIFIVNSFGSLR